MTENDDLLILFAVGKAAADGHGNLQHIEKICRPEAAWPQTRSGSPLPPIDAGTSSLYAATPENELAWSRTSLKSGSGKLLQH